MECMVMLITPDNSVLDKDSKVKEKRKENLQRKEELQTIEKNLKKIQITCHQ